MKCIDIFENLQRDLERHTEMLSNMVEEKTTKMLHTEYLNIMNQVSLSTRNLPNFIIDKSCLQASRESI